MFIAALLTIAMIWKLPMCSSTNEKRKYVCHTHTNAVTYTRILFGHKKENAVIATTLIYLWDIILRWNKPNIERKLPHDLTHSVESKAVFLKSFIETWRMVWF